MSDVLLIPSYAITMLFFMFSKIWVPLILAGIENGHWYIAFVEEEMLGQWELGLSAAMYLQHVRIWFAFILFKFTGNSRFIYQVSLPEGR